MEKPIERWESLGKDIGLFVSKRHTFGMDAVILARFAAPRKRDVACDLGAGCGIISFLWALGNGPARIDGVEMQQDGVELMTRSVDVNRLGHRIRPICADLRRYRPGQVYDLVACNPPYFKESAGTVSAEQGRRTARFEEAATLEDVVRCAAGILKDRGRFCMVHRPERLCDCMVAMREAGLEPKRIQLVHQRADKPPILLLAEGRKRCRPGMAVEPPLVLVGQDGRFTEEYRRMYDEQGESQWQGH
ncbi:tRNA1(Val) (adenine(37)-N6)-methyltransferase [Eubacteriaceae bacterium CHKCI005]|nr:tRNA1(Val) (adenine(37)-N6)-methyltransferase [Eubacteriaceae bacterium CHKCI005]